MEEPTVAELIRDMQASLARIERALDTYVTRELYQERHDAQERRITALEQNIQARSRTAWTAFIGPAIVGVVLLLLQGLQGSR